MGILGRLMCAVVSGAVGSLVGTPPDAALVRM